MTGDIFSPHDFREPLPDNPQEAVKALIQIGLKLEGALIAEQKALLEKSATLFQAAQEKKHAAFMAYDAATGEFRASIEKYKGVGNDIVGQLESLQQKIKKQTEQNIEIIMELLEKTGAGALSGAEDDVKRLVEGCDMAGQKPRT